MNLFEIVKTSVSVPEAARAYGLDVTRHNMVRCPFHTCTYEHRDHEIFKVTAFEGGTDTMAAPQYAIMRFMKYKGPEIGKIEAHDERTKESYASNPDIDPTRTHLNFHLVEPRGKYRPEAERQIKDTGNKKKECY